MKEEGIRLRTSDERYLRHVREYYEKLMPLLVPLQIDHGGPVLMMQVENEYGSFGNDKKYLESLRDMMRELGVTVPLFSSDGPQKRLYLPGALLRTGENEIILFESEGRCRDSILLTEEPDLG